MDECCHLVASFTITCLSLFEGVGDLRASSELESLCLVKCACLNVCVHISAFACSENK